MKYTIIILMLAVVIMAGCSIKPEDKSEEKTQLEIMNDESIVENETVVENKTVMDEEIIEEMEYKTAYFAGGCFWCMESAFEHLDGVMEAVSGFTGGEEIDPSYHDVASGSTGHRESIKVIYDSNKVTYTELLGHFWMQINPTDEGGQFVDRGFQYSSAIYYLTEEEKEQAENSKVELEKTGKYDEKIITPIIPAGEFYSAEEYHQDYYKKNPVRYHTYRYFSGRDQYLKPLWGDEVKEEIEIEEIEEEEEEIENVEWVKPSDEEIKATLTPLQYKVTQKDGTEQSFNNEYWDNKEEGIYVDLLSGEALFSSIDQYKSGTGWPSFIRPLDANNIVEKSDRKLIFKRTEIRSKKGDNHIGHVFNDGPEPTGLRYCMNSAAMRFVPKADMKKEGYGDYLYIFEDTN